MSTSRQRQVHGHTSAHFGAYRVIKDSPVRVATLGRTFLDLLREPGLCGGSRKLDPAADYAPQFSERWPLSINTTTPRDWT